MKELLKEYKKKRKEIRRRLQYFSRIYNKNDKELFKELCFCILTPQSKAVVCDGAIKKLQKRDLLFRGCKRDIKLCLKGVRFPNNKAQYLIAARNFFKNCKDMDIKTKIETNDVFKTRDWLVRNVRGIGYKEASHFLRNIGLGKDLAILDRHILKNLKRYKVIRKFPRSLGRKNYIKIEDKMRNFFKKVNIPIEEIDILFWSKETGLIFK